jgi:hypothetical protein
MSAWVIDTNAGPIVRFNGSVAACRAHVERSIPLLQRRGYTCEWTRSNGWHVANVRNSRGRIVHACAFRRA